MDRIVIVWMKYYFFIFWQSLKAIWEDILADSELTTGDEMDLTKVLHPLAYYMTDHNELLDQLFTTVKGTLLSSVMPTVLKVGSSFHLTSTKNKLINIIRVVKMSIQIFRA